MNNIIKLPVHNGVIIKFLRYSTQIDHKFPLSLDILSKFRNDFYSDPKNELAQNVCTRFDPFEVAISRKKTETTLHVYNIKIQDVSQVRSNVRRSARRKRSRSARRRRSRSARRKRSRSARRTKRVKETEAKAIDSEAKPVTNQENSGRCWLFAALNVMRLPFMKKYGIEEFEFSQSYLFFWDKIERAHYWLNNIVATARQGEQLEGRLVNFLLKDPINDGGQWDMIVNLVNKYGVIPKKCFAESFSSRRSLHMNALIKTKLREYAKELRDKVAANASDEDIQCTIQQQMAVIYNIVATCLGNTLFCLFFNVICTELRDKVAANASDEDIQCTIQQQMAVIYNIVATCLGTPPEKFNYEYYNKEKAYNSFGMLTPQEFYEKHVRPLFDVNNKVCLVSDPRQSNPFGQLYTLHCLGNVVGGRQTAYNNQPIETLMTAVKDSIAGGEAVWFGCEVSKRFERKNGFEDLDAQDYRLVFNTEVQIGMNKADRLMYGDSWMTHAMVFTAVGTDEKGNPLKFRVENSYSDKEYDKGYLLLTAPWFREFVFEVVVDKKYVPDEVLQVFKQEPKVLPAWDPMGTLACPFCSKE
ncbi:bleomycin hydrolase isoform X2 [Spodoptera frugiperda]|uniref:Bleomycin hydrolase n=1 Tax=Spodoptera frugiperda TaxID=7108 RepID=A0A9R0DU39_SPOFR|nr:bleomycin hydrolase isoform X2 [Spodoptera frugiperda]